MRGFYRLAQVLSDDDDDSITSSGYGRNTVKLFITAAAAALALVTASVATAAALNAAAPPVTHQMVLKLSDLSAGFERDSLVVASNRDKDVTASQIA